MDLSRAVSFVRANGNDLEQIRLKTLLGQPANPEIAVRIAAETQLSDGGWKPFWTDVSALDSTCYRLAQLEQAGVTGLEASVKHALQFLATRQREEGFWEEEELFADMAPPWCQPGNLDARLYLTANCSYWLAFFHTASDQVRRAAEFLERYVDNSGTMPSFLHTHWLSAGVLYAVGRQSAAERIRWYLHRKSSELHTSHLVWLINSLQGVGLPTGDPLLEVARLQLAAKQESDGRFCSEDGPDSDVHTTLEAIRCVVTQ